MGDDGHTLWRERRRQLEARFVARRLRSTPYGLRRKILPSLVVRVVVTLACCATGLYGRALRNAQAVDLNEAIFHFPHLPPAFDGYTILHLSDLHAGIVPGLEDNLAALLAGRSCDLGVLTGDFQSEGLPSSPRTAALLAPVLAAPRLRDGWLAVLGNHDRADLVESLAGQGVRTLVNHGVTLQRHGHCLHVVGTDDVHLFHTPAADAALAAWNQGFRIALVHSVDLAHVAEKLGYALYLAGHTHGGQLCLPGERPLMTSLDSHRRLAVGRWRLGELQGYTSRGAGSSMPPVRLNSRPEATLIRLRCGSTTSPWGC